MGRNQVAKVCRLNTASKVEKMKYYLAIDIGASSGRHIVGWLDRNEIQTEEVYRFRNGTKMQNKHQVWDLDSLFEHVKKGIKAAFSKYPDIQSLAIDTWGVDYALMTDGGRLDPCFSYRDNRTDQAVEEVHRIVPFEELYARTGAQFQPFNTIYQLSDDLQKKRLTIATDFLMLPEYLNERLTGVKMHEYTNATTTGLVNVRTKNYDMDLLDRLGLPKRLFGRLYQPGASVGRLKPEIVRETGGQTEVVLCASHDTASAVEGIPMDGNNPYISSGTWSLLGLKVSNAITDADSREANFTNEGGVGYTRYQKNIMGMWVVNCLKEELCPERPLSQIVEEARHSAFNDFVNIDDRAFLSPKRMKDAFDAQLKGKRKPQSESDYFRCAFMSLAVSYRNALDELKKNSGKEFDTLYIVGGGAKNRLLNGLTEQICKIKVKAIPIEATAIGNLKIQIGRKENVR